MGPNTLIVIPHPDDEIAWCYSQLNENTTVLLLSKSRRSPASQMLSRELGFELIEAEFPDLHFSEHFDEILKMIEDTARSKDYDRLFYTASSQHQDHATVNNIMRIMTRPLATHFNEVFEYPYLTYEYTEYNSIFEVPERKYELLKEFDMGKNWEHYIRSFNQFIAARHSKTGYYEPFKLLFKEGAHKIC